MKLIDLHVHSCFSDGSLTPEELTSLALETGLSAYALTDHDTTDGIDRAVASAAGTGLEVVPGIEFSTSWQHCDVHILGYYIDYHAPSFQERLHGFLADRASRNVRMCARVQEYTGCPISVELLKEHFPGAVITRAHMAAWLVEQGVVRTRSEAFARYVGAEAPCFIPKAEVSPVDAVRLILSHGGVPVLAHPLLYQLPEAELFRLVEELKEAGLTGIETIYSLHSASDEAFVRRTAETYGLIMTGGSDFHGANKPDTALGTGCHHNIRIPYELLEGVRAAHERLISHTSE